MGLEATSWGWLRDGVKKALPAFSLLERVENGVGVGMADVNYLIRGKEGWIELKAVLLPIRLSTAVLGPDDGLNPSQINWHLQRAMFGGRTWIFVSAEPFRWLVAGVNAAKVNDWTIDDFAAKATFWYDDKWGKTEWTRLINMLAW